MYAGFVKRLLDFLIALTAIIALSPILIILTAVGAICMKGNPFFTQQRPGRINRKTGEEKLFTVIKFRTMDNRRGADGELLPDEDRLNGYGKFLRSTSLDELPQLVNVLVGDEAICGPRALLVEYLPRYSEHQRLRHRVRPGITGYAQVHGRNLVSWEDKFEMDVWYTEHVTFKNDLKILFDTVSVVLKREGISSETSATMEEFMGSPKNAKVTWEAPQ